MGLGDGDSPVLTRWSCAGRQLDGLEVATSAVAVPFSHEPTVGPVHPLCIHLILMNGFTQKLLCLSRCSSGTSLASYIKRSKTIVIREYKRVPMHTTSMEDLSPRGFQRLVVVRISRIWENRDQAPHVYELGFIVFGQQGNTIEGRLSVNRIDQFGEKLGESLIYNLESFKVIAARSKYRTADHPYRIKVTHRTKDIEISKLPTRESTVCKSVEMKTPR